MNKFVLPLTLGASLCLCNASFAQDNHPRPKDQMVMANIHDNDARGDKDFKKAPLPPKVDLDNNKVRPRPIPAPKLKEHKKPLLPKDHMDKNKVKPMPKPMPAPKEFEHKKSLPPKDHIDKGAKH